MLKNKELTAEAARKLSEANLPKVSLETVLAKIEEVAEKGDTSVIFGSLSIAVLCELRSRGFNVGKMLYSNNDIRVSWK